VSAVATGLLLAAGGYLAGSIPFGYVLARLFLGVDVRTVGSGNIGGTNVARAGGKKLGAAVIALDAAKAIVPILLARALLGDTPQGELWVVVVAVAAFVGHLFPVWLGFKGGKGVATGLGIFVVLSPWAALAGLGAWVLAYLATRISSVGSLAGSAVCAAGTFVAFGAASPVSWAGLVLALLIWLRHRENIRRILSGEEKRKMRV
jgi:acyl phosphate:glycerol-3-phosphate acyltransferase